MDKALNVVSFNWKSRKNDIGDYIEFYSICKKWQNLPIFTKTHIFRFNIFFFLLLHTEYMKYA